MTELKQGTWVLVADSEKALFLENVTDGGDPYLVVTGKERQENPSDREQSANRPGRKADTGPGQRSALDDTDWHELAKERFAHDLAGLLYEKAHRGEFDHIVLACAPQVLGALRKELHKEVLDKVVAEVPKTLTNHPLDEIEKIVKGDLEAA
ncbi:host attachment family protein [Vannielia litorea]|uniref:Protein required for attachment to host cells n=1 Tax=Vannielia litorea TaxID=1217970 RepID=A0A1N6EQ41_9RHOB|nr:host attachment family protein [Vannielia litorea]SIN85209.1 Protein required for attachment to host cells [Vannielia litorea]